MKPPDNITNIIASNIFVELFAFALVSLIVLCVPLDCVGVLSFACGALTLPFVAGVVGLVGVVGLLGSFFSLSVLFALSTLNII